MKHCNKCKHCGYCESAIMLDDNRRALGDKEVDKLLKVYARTCGNYEIRKNKHKR